MRLSSAGPGYVRVAFLDVGRLRLRFVLTALSTWKKAATYCDLFEGRICEMAFLYGRICGTFVVVIGISIVGLSRRFLSRELRLVS